jgi:hypothetical protein
MNGTGDVMELNVIGFVVAALSAIGLLVAAERAGLGQAPDPSASGAPSLSEVS